MKFDIRVKDEVVVSGGYSTGENDVVFEADEELVLENIFEEIGIDRAIANIVNYFNEEDVLQVLKDNYGINSEE